jgi:agmatine deiminase
MDNSKMAHFAMPAEWERHEATWMTFPHNVNTWPERLPKVQKVYAEMVAHVSTGERVDLLVQDKTTEEIAKSLIFSHPFARPENIVFHPIPTMDSWIRDYGPTFVVNRQKRQAGMVHWVFNAWGMKYEHEEKLSNDKIIPDRMNEILGMKKFKPGIVMEGGSIEVDGKGSLITSEQCLLNKNRNPGLSRLEIERFLSEYLNVDRVIWVGEGVDGDDTDGHIDDMVRFVAPNRVLALAPDRNDSNYLPMRENFNRLENAGLDVLPLPMPRPLFVDNNQRRLPASYANFYIGNTVVIVPVFGDAKDKEALDLIAQCFPGRGVIGLYAADVVYGFGAWHCLTQQQPLV